MKEWVAQVSELNSYLKDFPAHSKNTIQPLNADDLLDILEFGVPANEGEPKSEKFSKPKTTGKRKAKVSTTPTTTLAGKRKFYCEMHGCNRIHDTEDCFELKQRAKRAKPNTNCAKADKVS
eukprot:14466075-Ditylum_brightwellii.AAC.1